MQVPTSAVCDKGSSIVLMLKPTEELISRQAWVVSILPEQIPIKELHVTLMPSTDSERAFPSPSPFVDLCDKAYAVTAGGKTSVYLRAADISQSELADYVAKTEEILHASGLQNKARIFHASLSNLVGSPDASVANVWEYASTPLQG